MRTVCLVIFIHTALLLSTAFAGEDVLRCAVAQGYPPYQFQAEGGDPAGIDVDVITEICKRMGLELQIEQGPWNDMVALLRQGRVDCVSGMEINEKRMRIFDFSSLCYSRKSAVFTRQENEFIKSLNDLKGMVIAGDRQSDVEKRLTEIGLYSRIRIRHTKSKAISMQYLENGEVVAVIVPKAVGFYLADAQGMGVNVVYVAEPGSPVGIAMCKGNMKLRHMIEGVLSEMRIDGTLDRIFKKWHMN